MKNPKGSYNDDALNDLLKQFMLDEAAGGRAADSWLDAEAEAVFASEPEHQPSKQKEAALIASLNAKLGAGSKGGGMVWKGTALGIALLGVVATTLWFWPDAQTPLANNTANPWSPDGFENANLPYYDGSNYQPAALQPAAIETPNDNSSTVADNTPIERPTVRINSENITLADTLPAATYIATSAPKPKNSAKTLLKELKRRLETFTETFPAERIYAQTDRTDYVPGQDLWFSTYLLGETDLKPSTISTIIKTELLNASGEPVALKEWVANNGRVSGHLAIPQELASGTYLFRAYTAWQQYLPGSKIFEAPIVVQQPGQVLRMEQNNTQPAPLHSIAFYPEGGDLVEGLESRVAFRITESSGKAQGTIVDQTGKTVATFTANAEGEGLFAYTPTKDHQYIALVPGLQPAPLPKPYPTGYVMQVLGQEGNWLKVNIKATAEDNVVLVAQLRNTLYYGAEHELQPGDNWVKIPLGNLPAGVLHLSLFDAEGIGHAERLVFVNKQKQLNIAIKTDKVNYLPREKVTAQITVTDDKGRPVQTTLSLSAMDDLLTHTQNTNILSALLLEPDLAGVAHHAGYLFDPANKNADQQLDLLLMTQGWRRFTWREVYYNQHQPLATAPENAVLRGKVIDAVTRKPLKDVTLSNKILGLKTTTAADGSFYIPNLDLSQLREIDLSYKIGLMTLVVNRYQNDLVIEFAGDGRKVYQPQANSRQHPVLTGSQPTPKGTAIAGQVINAYGNGVVGATITLTAADGSSQQLKTDALGYYLVATPNSGGHKITISAPGYNTYQNPIVKTEANKIAVLDVLLTYDVNMSLPAHFINHAADTLANRYGFLAGKFDPAYNNPLEEAGKNILLNEVRTPLRDGTTAYYIEGMKLRYNEPLMLPISAIGHEGKFDNGMPSQNPAATVLEVTNGSNMGISGTVKAPENRPSGFNVRYAQPREYPKTQYTARDRAEERTDLRSTLYWNGNITTDGNGQATVTFYASDDLSAFRLIVEGVGTNGMPGRNEQLVGIAWPFDLHVQLPDNLKKGDKIPVQLWVSNYTGKQITGAFDFDFPTGLKPIWPLAPKEHGLFPQRNDTITVQFEVIDPQAVGTLTVGFTANGYRDTFVYKLPVKKED